MNIFNRFVFSFGSKKNKYLPAGNDVTYSIQTNTIEYPVNAYKTIASFDLDLQKPKYQGAIPDATIKFYPLD